jgi:hypothetical protein
MKEESYTVKNAVELLGAPSRNSVLMLKKYNITDEIFWLSSHVFFSTLLKSKKFRHEHSLKMLF